MLPLRYLSFLALFGKCTVAYDFISPYTITGCDDKQQLLIKSHIRALKASVSRAAFDAANGVRSQHGFQAFFKSNTSMAFVRHILLDVQLGRTSPVKYSPEGDLSVSAPQIVCAMEENLEKTGPLAELQPWAQCSEEEHTIGFYYEATPYIILCPVFWTLRADPQPDNYRCGRVDSNNQFAGGHAPEREGATARAMPAQAALTEYQVYHLFHEIVHFYLGSKTLGDNTVPEEVYDWNDCLALDASSSKRNPMNYQLYLASESMLTWILEIF